MLNYFLKYLTGPERKGLKVRERGGMALLAAPVCSSQTPY
jgi:hypothetical protein